MRTPSCNPTLPGPSGRCFGLRIVSQAAFAGSLFLGTYFSLVTPALAQKQSLESLLLPLINGHKGEVAVEVRHLPSGEGWSYRADQPMPTASLIKLPVMIEAYRQAAEGKINLEGMIALKSEDLVPGSGILTKQFSPGLNLSLRDAIRLMIVYSDNTATNLVLDAIGLTATADTMQRLGFPETRIHSKVFKRETSIAPQRSEKYGLGSTTAHDMVEILAKLHRGELVNQQACQQMLDHLLNCDDKAKFPAMLPSGTKLAHKTGSVTRVRTDAGLILADTGAIALCVLTDKNEDTRWTDDNSGNVLCAKIAKETFDYFCNAKPPKATSISMHVGANGELVESLQRTLNARITSAERISIDGDFGSATEAAVKRFQTQAKLEPTGIVDAATWKALGPLIATNEPVPEPEKVNTESLLLVPADDPLGRPHVTSKAWTIADANSGEVLWQEKGLEVRDIASTTKIMTAYIVLGLAAKDPQVLDEVIVFSERADKTVGSTAGLRAGERISVRDLMYGLLLPSGNDASVAFAEHFGDRCQPSSNDQSGKESDSYSKFIAEMNRQAALLGMTSTTYINPHGLTDEKHKSTANELAKLTVVALHQPLFRAYTSKRQYGCKVTGAEGYERNVMWSNTNQLLGIEGYTGVKTGTTDAAGACLVATGKRGDRELLVIVLGSASSPARYADSRNLFAWAWRQIETENAIKRD